MSRVSRCATVLLALVPVLTAQPVRSAGAVARPQFGPWGIDLTAMDLAVRPGDNFFDYANGSRWRRAVIPADRSSTGATDDLRIESEARLRTIVEALQDRPYDSLSGEERQLRDLYEAFVDEAQIERRGLQPARDDLARLASLRSREAIARAMGAIEGLTGGFFELDIGIDRRNPSHYSVTLRQSGLGLPDRDYYLRDDPAMVATRDAYLRYLSTFLRLLGLSNPDARAAAVLQLETRMARVEWPRAERRDVSKTYHPMSLRMLTTSAPGFPWAAFLGEAGVPLSAGSAERTFVVAEESAFAPLAAIFAAAPLPVLRDYLTVRYLHAVAPFLPKRFDDANFALYGTELGGRTTQLPRATRGVQLLNTTLGEALGKLYVARYFPPDAEAKANVLVGNLLKAYEIDLTQLPWLSTDTRTRALEKIRDMTLKIGYPSHWRDYSTLVIRRSDLIGDIKRASLYEWRRELRRLDGPVDRTEWDMTPSTVNAYYTPSLNEIVFPAAILQPPFFDPNADDAVNYGGIGAVIGHEISHGFDDQGSKYDSRGVFTDWWSGEDRRNFAARTAALVAQFDAYEPLPDLHINGANTLGENIADLAGLSIALKAYHLAVGGSAVPVLDGFTGDQRFFLSIAQIWRAKLRESALRTQVLSNVHSPAEFRVIGPTRNMDAWYTAFGIGPRDKYYLAPEQRVRLW